MERREFYENCEKIADFHMPRWEELPEIEKVSFSEPEMIPEETVGEGR